MRFWPLLALFLMLHPVLAHAEGRVALLIGNGAYQNSDFSLDNPPNDVRALDAALTRLGFEVRAEVDLTRTQMLDALDWLGSTGNGADIAMLFYAGHAVQVGSENLAIGVGLKDVSAADVAQASVSLSEMLAAIERTGAALSMVVLDACRDNPLDAAQIGTAGLSPVSGDVGTLVAYATDPGNIAADGTGNNSVFTTALLEHIETPGIDVRIMLGRVRQEVVRMTGGQQVPWVEEAVIGEHYLADAPDAVDADRELLVWREAVAAGTDRSYAGYLDQFPGGLYQIVAELRRDALQGTAPAPATIPQADLPKVQAALEMAGYLVPAAQTLQTRDIAQAFAGWQARQPASARTIDALVSEAARTAAFVGTYTVGILKNDLRRYASIDETLRTARQSLRVAEEDFGDNPDAQDVLASMRTDVLEIGAIYQSVAGDLDASRTYYSDLITLTAPHLAQRMSQTAQPRFGSSRGITRLSNRALSDAQTFFEHLKLAQEAPDGSFAWLAAMMKEF